MFKLPECPITSDRNFKSSFSKRLMEKWRTEPSSSLTVRPHDMDDDVHVVVEELLEDGLVLIRDVAEQVEQLSPPCLGLLSTLAGYRSHS